MLRINSTFDACCGNGTRRFQLATHLHIYYVVFVAGVNFEIHNLANQRSGSDIDWVISKTLIVLIMASSHTSQ